MGVNLEFSVGAEDGLKTILVEDGALYRFNWVFPTGRTLKGGIGFSDSPELAGLQSYALLRDEQIDARMRCELKDHPLLLIHLAIFAMRGPLYSILPCQFSRR